jgi:chromate transporter
MITRQRENEISILMFWKKWHVKPNIYIIEKVSNVMKSDYISRSKKITDTYFDIFKRFLKFGFLAWGGSVAQIDMIRQELVEEEKWVSQKTFNRILGVYQALPGPEAHELCVYFGMVARGRLGGFLAGLGFMLPGFLLILFLSWFYITIGINSPILASLFFGIQAAVIALIFRAVHRIGKSVITNYWLLLPFFLTVAGEILKIHFLITLISSGLIYLFLNRRKFLISFLLITIFLIGIIGYSAYIPIADSNGISTNSNEVQSSSHVTLLSLFGSGLKSGLLTFGGAYTVIPFLRNDAVNLGKWMTDAAFLDGLGLSGILPAPLVIFGTFVGYLGGGFLGALAVTAGIFLPAFGFTLVLFKVIEKLSQNKTCSHFLNGVTAGVVGIITVTAIDLFRIQIINLFSLILVILSLIILYRWKSKLNVPVVVISAGLISLLATFLQL